MSTWKVIRCLECALLAASLGVASPPARACSCNWEGPFLTVARKSPLVVRAKVLRHRTGAHPALEVLVLETLAGGLLDTGLVVHMGDGMMCRPGIEGFPIGSEWVLALNGPGSKPGDGLALSHCGEYWLRVENGQVSGSLDGKQGEVQRMTLRRFSQRFHFPAFKSAFRGQLRAGERYRQAFGGRFEFRLEPRPDGWEIAIVEFGRDENLARLTPPLHFAPNPREIAGWQFQKDGAPPCPRPYGNAPPPGKIRSILFSPEVGRSVDGPRSQRSVEPSDIEAVRGFGQAGLEITAYALQSSARACPRIASLEFTVEIDGGY